MQQNEGIPESMLRNMEGYGLETKPKLADMGKMFCFSSTNSTWLQISLKYEYE